MKILKNITNSPIDIESLAVTIVSNATYVVEGQDLLLLFQNDAVVEIESLIEQNKIIVTNASGDLSKDVSKKQIQFPSDSESITFNGQTLEEKINELSGNFQPNPVSEVARFDNRSNGNINSSAWLYHGRGLSNSCPFIVAYNSSLSHISFTNNKDDSDVRVEVYKNASLYITITKENTRWFIEKTFSQTYSFAAGDRVSVKVARDGNTGLKTPVVHIGFKNTDQIITNVSGGTL